MSTLTFEQQTARDRLVGRILGDATLYIKNTPDATIPDWEIAGWEAIAEDYNLSKKAISQTVDEVRQILEFMAELAKKRVA